MARTPSVRTSGAGRKDDVAAKSALDCHGAVGAGVDGEGGGGAARRREKQRGEAHGDALGALEHAVTDGRMR